MAQGPESRDIAIRVSSNDLGLWTPDARKIIERVNIDEAVAPTQGMPVEDFTTESPKVVNIRLDNSTSMRAPGRAQAMMEGHNLIITALRKGFNPNGVVFGSSFMNKPRPTHPEAFFIHGRDALNFQPYSSRQLTMHDDLRPTDRYSQVINGFTALTAEAVEGDAQPVKLLTPDNLYLQGFTPFNQSSVEALTATGAKLDEFKADYRPGVGITVLFTDGRPERDTMRASDLRTMVQSLMPMAEGDARNMRNLVVGYGAGDERTFTDLFLEAGIPKGLILTSGTSEREILEKFDMIATMTAQANSENIRGLAIRGFN